MPTGWAEENGDEEEIAECLEVAFFVLNTLQKEDLAIQNWEREREKPECWVGLCDPTLP